ncbi:bile acid:sodium symporter family protein [Alteromonas flava]|uniref:bile acid:sodium symporter family protein n=1 Tax=Alteromonas flava TaxID=2048003 RepID=UPI000C29519B|nr:bile acid:sodium symporter family protein [Alteromonas flava]
MQGSILSQVILPLVLAMIMFGMGLSLTRDDFARLLRIPQSVIAGLIGQVIILPLLAFGLAIVLALPPYLAVGVMVLAACPGGTTSNLISHIARANLALSITLTAITTLICVFTTPLIIQFSLHYFGVDSPNFSLINTTLGLIVISLIPVLLGLFVRHKAPVFAQRQEPVFRKLAVIFMIAMIAGISWQERTMLMESFPRVFVITLTLNILATLLGVIIAKLVFLSPRDATTLGIEIGTQNASMAILITLTFLDDPSYAIACGVYGVTMYVGAFALVYWHKYQPKQPG